jgi:hypothetical protein
MNARKRLSLIFSAAAILGWSLAGCASAPRQPVLLPPVAETFPAPYDAVWDATMQSLGVIRVLTAQKGAGLIQTEPFPFTYTVGSNAPERHDAPLVLASSDPGGIILAQGGGSGGPRPTQVVWIAMHITVSRTAPDATQVQVEPRVHHELIPGAFMPGPYNSPWGDLFARIRNALGRRASGIGIGPRV